LLRIIELLLLLLFIPAEGEDDGGGMTLGLEEEEVRKELREILAKLISVMLLRRDGLMGLLKWMCIG
jgi:hypothetical protein